MRVLFINNAGAGFADHVEVEPQVTIEKFFARQMGSETSPADYLIRVNRLPAARDQVLQENDRVSITPVKISGARAHAHARAHPRARARARAR